jgi:hypothetical protein
MTYGCVRRPGVALNLTDAAVSHLAELVRGYCLARKTRPPHPPLRGTFSPWGEGFRSALSKLTAGLHVFTHSAAALCTARVLWPGVMKWGRTSAGSK